MDSSSQDEDNSILYEETSRQLQEQIETTRAAKVHGAKIIRIIATLLTILLAITSTLITVLLSDLVSLNELDVSINQSKLVETFGLFSEIQYTILSFFIIFGLLFYFNRLFQELGTSFNESLKIMSPIDIQRGADLGELEDKNSPYSKGISDDVIENNIEIIKDNAKKVNDIQHRWEISHSSLVDMLYSSVFFALLLLSLVVNHGVAILCGSLLLMYLHYRWVLKNNGHKTFKNITKNHYIIDISKILSALLISTLLYATPGGGGVLPRLLVLLGLVPPIIACYRFWKNFSGDEIVRYSSKEVFLATYLMILFIFLLGNDNIMDSFPLTLLGVLFILSFIYAMIAAVVGAWSGAYHLSEKYGFSVSGLGIIISVVFVAFGYLIEDPGSYILYISGISSLVFFCWAIYDLYSRGVEITETEGVFDSFSRNRQE
ncbi:hypothetical protein RBH20_13225 [Haloarcula sp. H-GB4]|uniref:hypothetical protein n=1 Tax=Haloarcula sp. H-GB4 TaxID=3069755 RepID=UPI0027B874D6|nr:hypothetical protein [Haloarcula sp. H-GB4]MDQ2073499.1 hypothetical protein [Haloarcula sp. H-GB4]